jgi:hypothetical protein
MTFARALTAIAALAVAAAFAAASGRAAGGAEQVAPATACADRRVLVALDLRGDFFGYDYDVTVRARRVDFAASGWFSTPGRGRRLLRDVEGSFPVTSKRLRPIQRSLARVDLAALERLVVPGRIGLDEPSYHIAYCGRELVFGDDSVFGAKARRDGRLAPLRAVVSAIERLARPQIERAAARRG